MTLGATSVNGWPVIPAYKDPDLVTLEYLEGSTNIKRGDVATVFAAFLADYVRLVGPIVKKSSWGYAPRKQHGSNRTSNHASGTAVDINVHLYPEFKRRYIVTTRARLQALLEHYPVIRWGGNYAEDDLDEMHFEINASQAEVAEFVKTLKPIGNLPIDTTPPTKETNYVSTKMVSPVEGRATSEYGKRAGTLHAGLDIATNQKPGPVYAAFGGTLVNIVRGRKHKQAASSGQVVATGRSGNGTRVHNPDGEVQVYIHVDVLDKWKNGDTIKAGELIGYTDLSGNTTGFHLHFETWNSKKATRNPRDYFGYHGIAVGSKPVVGSAAPAKPPVVAPSKPVAGPIQQPSAGGKYNQHIANVQQVLISAGYDPGPVDGIDGDRTRSAVAAYQRNQNNYGQAGLLVDGIWGLNGPTDKWFNWVKRLQSALNAFVGGDIRIDGDYAGVTRNRVKEVQSRNRLFADGIAGNKTLSWMRSKGSSIDNRP